MFKTLAELKRLTAQSASWSTNDWDFGDDTKLPTLKKYKEKNGSQVEGELMCGQSAEHVQCAAPRQPAVPAPPVDRAAPVAPSKPVLAQKQSALAPTQQAYTATFAGGTLYWLLRAGKKSDEVTGANIKDGADPVGTNKGNAATSPKEVALTGSASRQAIYALCSDRIKRGAVPNSPRHLYHARNTKKDNTAKPNTREQNTAHKSRNGLVHVG